MGDSTRSQQTGRKKTLGIQRARLKYWTGTRRPRQFPINQPRFIIRVLSPPTVLRCLRIHLENSFCFRTNFYLIKEISERKENEGLSAMELRPPEKVRATKRVM